MTYLGRWDDEQCNSRDQGTWLSSLIDGSFDSNVDEVGGRTKRLLLIDSPDAFSEDAPGWPICQWARQLLQYKTLSSMGQLRLHASLRL